MALSNDFIAGLREDYKSEPFEMKDADDNPIIQFEHWMDAAVQAKMPEPNAMTISTIGLDGGPNARVVLLKGIRKDGFVFYTNYNSEKGKEIELNPSVNLVFLWLGLSRQIRIKGIATKVSPEVSDAYFGSRPKGSQIGAHASPQSQEIKDRSLLEENVIQLQKRYKNEDKLPRPAHWGGYIIKPSCLEFWQGRTSRLHDRIVYNLVEGKWSKLRLAP